MRRTSSIIIGDDMSVEQCSEALQVNGPLDNVQYLRIELSDVTNPLDKVRLIRRCEREPEKVLQTVHKGR